MEKKNGRNIRNIICKQWSTQLIQTFTDETINNLLHSPTKSYTCFCPQNGTWLTETLRVTEMMSTLVWNRLKFLIKLSDFGLTRCVSGKKYYKMQSKMILPLRRMAPEAVLYKTFTYATFLFAPNRKNQLQHYVNLETAPHRANCNRFFWLICFDFNLILLE